MAARYPERQKQQQNSGFQNPNLRSPTGTPDSIGRLVPPNPAIGALLPLNTAPGEA